MYKGEQGYLELLETTYLSGVDIPDRTGVGRRAVYKATIEHDSFPFSTIRPASHTHAWEEMLFFLNGDTDINILSPTVRKWWEGNTSAEFLKNTGKEHLTPDNMNKMYSHQWRNAGGVVDQLHNLVNELKSNRYSSRLIVDILGVTEQQDMPLIPCWWNMQVVVLPCAWDGEDELHLTVNNRSVDLLFGYSFAVQQYRMLQMVLAKMINVRVGKLYTDLNHVHVYHNQFDYIEELLQRDLGVQGEMIFQGDVKTLDDILTTTSQDFIIDGLVVNTEPFKTPRPKMAV